MNTPVANNTSLYVGDLLTDVNESQLFEIFKQAGAVASIRVCRDAVTRRSLGYAYVNFHNAQDAKKALDTINYKDIKGKPCRIMWSQRDPSVRRNQVGNIFIKNLHKTIDNKSLYETFSAFGDILSCVVATDEHGNSKGYGFIHFEKQESADQAIELVNGKSLNGKICYVAAFQARKDREKELQKVEPKWTNIYVKPLPKSVDNEQLKTMFSKYGELTSVAIMSDDKGEAKGFGFINFAKHEDAKKAVEDLNGKEYEGQTLFVGRAQKKSEREKELKETFSKIQKERMNKYQGVNLYVKNLDETIDDDKLRAEFSVCGTITSARIMKDDKGRSKGFGFVCFSTPEEATKAVTEFNGRLIVGKPIYVGLAQKRDQRRAQLEAQFSARNASIRMQQQAQASGVTGSPIFGPMFYPPGGRGFVYPPQMMGRGRFPARAMPPFIPGFPPGAVPQQGHNQGRKGKGRGGQQNAPAYPMNIKYNPNVRNPGAPIPQPQQPAQPDLSVPMTEDRKHQIGEALYPLLQNHLASMNKENLAGKITGMLLDSLDQSELMNLLESTEALAQKTTEALEVLAAASLLTENK